MKLKNRNLFLFLSGGTILLAIMLSAILIEPDIMHTYLFADILDSYMDYFNCIAGAASAKTSYGGNNNIYPPVCWLIFYLFGRFSGNIGQILETEEGARFLRMYQGPNVSFLLALLFMVLAIFCLIEFMAGFRRFENKWLSFLMVFSIPLLYTLERGNILILALTGTLVFFALKDSEKQWVRDIGYLCLAIAVAIKIYPAIFGFVLLKERKYKETIRLALYGIAVFTLPFLLLCKEGLWGIPFFFQNLLGFNSAFADIAANEAARASGQVEQIKETIEIVALDGGRIGFAAFMEHLFMWFGASANSAVQTAAKVSSILCAAACGACFFAKKNWQVMLLLAGVLVGFQGRSYVYTAVFMMIPCLYFLKAEKAGAINFIYLLLFGLIFFPLPLGWNEHMHEEVYYYTHRSFNSLQIGGAIWLITIVCIIDVMYQYAVRKKEKRTR